MSSETCVCRQGWWPCVVHPTTRLRFVSCVTPVQMVSRVQGDGEPERSYARARRFFHGATCSVEVLDARSLLQKLYFPRPVETAYLTSATRDAITWSVNRETQESKVNDLMESADMAHVSGGREGCESTT